MSLSCQNLEISGAQIKEPINRTSQILLSQISFRKITDTVLSISSKNQIRPSTQQLNKRVESSRINLSEKSVCMTRPATCQRRSPRTMKQNDSDEETKNINSVSSHQNIPNFEDMPSAKLYKPKIMLTAKNLTPSDSKVEKILLVSEIIADLKPQIMTPEPATNSSVSVRPGCGFDIKSYSMVSPSNLSSSNGMIGNSIVGALKRATKCRKANIQLARTNQMPALINF